MVTWLVASALALACHDDGAGPNAVASPARSNITASATRVTAGQVVTLTLTARDGSGRPVTGGGDLVVFTFGGGGSGGTVGPAIHRGGGVYQTTLTAVRSGTPSRVGATLNGVPVTTPEPGITVDPGPASAANSIVSVSRNQVDVGGQSILTLQARDLADNDLVAGGLSVSFADSGGTSRGTIGPVTDNLDGSYSASYTGQAVGTPAAIHATIGTGAVLSPAPTIAVTAGAASTTTSTLSVSTDSIVVGTSATLTLVSRDSSGVGLSGGGRTVEFMLVPGSGTSQGVIERDSVDLGNGSYTARFRGTAPGTAVQIAATIDGAPISTVLPTIAVTGVTSSPQGSRIMVSDSVLVAGDSAALTLTVLDVDGNQVPGGGAVVRFTVDSGSGRSGGSIDSTAVVDHGDGSYTGTFVATVSGTPAAIGATVDGTPVEMPDSNGVPQLPTIRVLPGSVSIDSSTLAVARAVLDVGDSTAISLVTRDAFGNALGTGGLAVAFTQQGATAGRSGGVFGPVTDRGDGSYGAQFTATIVGTPTGIGATIDGGVVTSGNPTIAVVCGSGPVDLGQSTVQILGLANGRIPSGVPVTVRFQARNAFGSCLRTTGLSVVFGLAGGSSTGTISPLPAIDHVDGTYSATFTGLLAGSPTIVTTTVDGNPVTSPAPTVAVDPGDVSAMTSVVSVADSLVDPGTIVALTLQTRDAAGNAITQDTLGLAVLFTAGGGSSGGAVGPTIDNGDGTFSGLFTASIPGSPLAVGATIDGSVVAPPLPTIEVDTVAPALSPVTINGAGSATVVAGDTAVLRLRARDDRGRDIRGAGKTVVFTVAGGSGASGGVIGATLDQGDGSYLAAVVATTAGGATSVGATIDGAAATGGSPTLTVVPGAASPATSTVATADSVVAVGGSTTLTLTARDAFGNRLSAGGLTVQFILAGGTSGGTLGPTTDNGDGTYQATFQGTVAGSPLSVGATIDGAPLTTPPPSLRVR